MKRNKIRYKTTVKEEKLIMLTGTVFLMYHNDEGIAQIKGDLMVYPECEALHTTRQGDYGSTGYVGYFKVDVWDGKEWRPVIQTEIFTDKENFFSKKECPIDTFAICEEILQSFAGRAVRRTYREHYEIKEAD